MIAWPVEQPTLIEGELKLRPFVAADAAAMCEYMQDWSNAQFTTTPWPYQMSDADAAIKGWASGFAEKRCMQFAICIADGPVIGHASLHSMSLFDHWSEVGYILDARYRGRGLATRAVSLLSDYAFTIGFRRLHAYIVAGHLPSVGVVERAGFEFESRMRQSMTLRDGSQTDGLVYAKLARPE